MSSPKLPNYLLAERKRRALSQDAIACLLGAQSGAKVCRYERFVREPSLRTALAYEAVFQKPVRELFAGLYEAMEREVAARATALARKNKSKPSITNSQAARADSLRRQPSL